MTRAKPAAPALAIDIRVDAKGWKVAYKVQSIVRRAVTQAAATLSTTGAELAIILTDDSAIRQLNRDWRGIDAATNVLSFPAPGAGGEPVLLGDVVLAFETIAREARAQHKPFAHHAAHLAVHGFLHLLGYGHERNTDALAMERLERKILHRLAIPDPYRDKAERPAGHLAKTRRPARQLTAKSRS